MNKQAIAKELVAMAKELVGMDFPTQGAMEKYLKDHPGADKSNHRVVEKTREEVDKEIEEEKRQMGDKYKPREKETPDEVEERLKRDMGSKYKPQEQRTQDAKKEWAEKTKGTKSSAVAKELVSLAKSLVAERPDGHNDVHEPVSHALDGALKLRNHASPVVRKAWNDVASSIGKTLHLIEVAEMLEKRSFVGPEL